MEIYDRQVRIRTSSPTLSHFDNFCPISEDVTHMSSPGTHAFRARCSLQQAAADRTIRARDGSGRRSVVGHGRLQNRNERCAPHSLRLGRRVSGKTANT